MQDRIHGNPPYRIVVLHGGPGAQGSMGVVAQVLGKTHGVLEPMQRAHTIQGQVDELHEAIIAITEPPITLIGWSWGAWLGWWYAAQHPELVKRLILVSSGPFETHYTANMQATRLSRLTPEEQTEIGNIQLQLENPDLEEKTVLFARFGELFEKADDFDPIVIEELPMEFDPAIYNAVWPAGAALRKSGVLLADTGKISMPVVAIHGDYDPHPWQGVKEPLSQRLTDFTFHVLPECGHSPWKERKAQEPFFRLLQQYL
ncbi:MAG: alpha/beta hydrolase [Anaerolineae bacterium]|jgi:pimeloyl-ACP methyl ester carboxylesterase|nr:alpha/beta hydrolase [Anaerolineae bacterium]